MKKKIFIIFLCVLMVVFPFFTLINIKADDNGTLYMLNLDYDYYNCIIYSDGSDTFLLYTINNNNLVPNVDYLDSFEIIDNTTNHLYYYKLIDYISIGFHMFLCYFHDFNYSSYELEFSNDYDIDYTVYPYFNFLGNNIDNYGDSVYQNAYLNGFSNGYQSGVEDTNSSINDVYNSAFEKGYQRAENEYTSYIADMNRIINEKQNIIDGFPNQLSAEYSKGFDDGVLSVDNPSNYMTFRNLFNSIFEFPLRFFKEGLNVNIFGLNLGSFVLFFFIIIVCLGLFGLVRKLFK